MEGGTRFISVVFRPLGDVAWSTSALAASPPFPVHWTEACDQQQVDHLVDAVRPDRESARAWGVCQELGMIDPEFSSIGDVDLKGNKWLGAMKIA
jgi:hypothetical protein